MARKMTKRTLLKRSFDGTKSLGFHAPQKAKKPKQEMPPRGKKS